MICAGSSLILKKTRPMQQLSTTSRVAPSIKTRAPPDAPPPGVLRAHARSSGRFDFAQPLAVVAHHQRQRPGRAVELALEVAGRVLLSFQLLGRRARRLELGHQGLHVLGRRREVGHWFLSRRRQRRRQRRQALLRRRLRRQAKLAGGKDLCSCRGAPCVVPPAAVVNSEHCETPGQPQRLSRGRKAVEKTR